MADGACNSLIDKPGSNSQGQELEGEAVGEAVAKDVHAADHIKFCSTDGEQTVEQPILGTATLQRRASDRGRRASNIVTRMKREPRTRKASVLRAYHTLTPFMEEKQQRGGRTHQPHSAPDTVQMTVSRQ